MQIWNPSTRRVIVLTSLFFVVFFVAVPTSFVPVVVVKAASANLLQNAGFESGLTNWYNFGGQASTSSSITHSGIGAVSMGTVQQGVAQDITLQPNTIYSLSGWGKTTGTGEYSQITLRITDNNNNQTNYQMAFTSTDWNRQARTITTPGTVQSALVFILKSAGSGYFYADDIFIGAGRDPQTWPFAQNSIWNTPIGSNAVYKTANLSVEKQFIVDEDYQVWGDSSAPWRSVNTRGSTSANDFGPCNQDSTQGSVGIPQGSTQLPDNYTLDNQTRSPNFTPNDQGVFIQGDGRTASQIAPFARCNNGGPLFGYRATDVDLYGPGTGGDHWGTGLSGLGGAIRPGELIGPNLIHHALQLEIWNEKNASNNPPFRWPADRGDNNSSVNYCSMDPCKSNPSAYSSIKAGTLFSLPPNVTEQSLGIKTAMGDKIFRALQDYGGYMVDDTGWYFQSIGADPQVHQEAQQAYGYDFNVSSSATGAALDWYNDLYTMFSNLSVVDNNSPTSIGGGGTPGVALAPDFSQPAPPVPVALDRTGWAVSASINNAQAANMLDGNTTTAWQTNTAQAQGQNFVVDMQKAQLFNQVVLDNSDPSFYTAFPQGYEIDVSNDHTTWTQLSAGTASGNTPNTVTFPAVTARYIKVQLQNGNINGVNNWAVDEFNVYNTNRAVPLDHSNWTATASTTCCSWPALAFDGDPQTRWTNGQPQSSGDWFQLDMASPQTFNQLTLDSMNSPTDYPRQYQIFVSNDGTSWGKAIASGNGSNPVTDITFPTQTARYLKIAQTGSTTTAWWSIDELNLYQPKT